MEVGFYNIEETALQDDIVFLTSMLTTTTRQPLGLVKTLKYGSTNVPSVSAWGCIWRIKDMDMDIVVCKLVLCQCILNYNME